MRTARPRARLVAALRYRISGTALLVPLLVAAIVLTATAASADTGQRLAAALHYVALGDS